MPNSECVNAVQPIQDSLLPLGIGMQQHLRIGISRKGMIWKPLGITPNDALCGTVALNLQALLKGADIIRVHDVAEARQCVKLWELLTKK